MSLPMRIALVSPYSWTYPGGVTRHTEALADEFLAAGHFVRVLAPYDPDDRLSAVLHRGARPHARPAPEHLVSLGRTAGFPANGAVSNVAFTPYAFSTARRTLREGAFDVVHLQEPMVPIACSDACVANHGIPLVGTFHAYSTNRLTNNLANVAGLRRYLNHLHVRIAVSEAAAWTGKRFFGGRYRVIPNGVEVPESVEPKHPSDRLRVLFVGQAVERKGLPIALRAVEALRDHLPVELTIVGAGEEEVAPLLLDARDVRALGKVDDATKHAELQRADVLVAPSLGGESFGMVLTEAFAAGTPVIASDIAGYRDVVRDGVDGLLVPRGDATALAESLRDLWFEPRRRAALGAAAREHASRYAWSHVAEEVLEAYEDAIAVPAPATARARAAVRFGLSPADGLPKVPAARVPHIDPPPPARRRVGAIARRAALATSAIGGLVLAWLAIQHIGLHSIATALLNSSPPWVLAGLGLMCGAMVLRAISWHAILRAALPNARLRITDALQGTFIGVLMSATLPARLGELSRALVVARRTGRPREALPVVAGTVISQTVLNIVALLILGIVMFSSLDLFSGHEDALLVAAILPLGLLATVLVAPALIHGPTSRFVRLQRMLARLRAALASVRSGLVVFRRPRLGAMATTAQLSAWALQWLACYALLVALGLNHKAGIGAAAAVLFAVNITAVLPVTPSNLGVFQAACVAVLAGGYGVSSGAAVGYGVILQAVEVVTAIVMGMPALVTEGLSWREVRMRALHASPVVLPARPAPVAEAAAEPAEA